MKHSMKEKLDIRDGLKIVACFVGFFVLILAYPFFNTLYEDKLFRENYLETECVVIEVFKSRTGVRGPKYGYDNKCQYYIGDNVHYCQIFTSIKYLPIGEEITVQYYQFTKGRKKGRVHIRFSEEMKLKYHEYGFNDYGL